MATIFEKTSIGRLLKYLNGGVNTSIGQHSYPYDLGSEEYGHYIQFFINETSTGQNPLDNKSPIITNRDDPGVQRATTPKIEGQTGATRDQDGATGVRGRRVFGSAGRTRRITDSITLYMPENITTTYGADWENFNISTGAILGSRFGNIGTAVDSFETFDKSTLSNLKTRLSETYKSVKSNFSGTKGLSNKDINDLIRSGAENINPLLEAAIQTNLRQARNPYMEFLFRGVQQRSFTFEFKFTPRSEDEARRVRDIIRLFKLHALPEVREGVNGIYYRYPSEFDVVFMANGKENNFLHKISTCALVNIDVNYTGAGTQSFHRETIADASTGELGASPTHTNITLQFMELELMSQQRIEEGY